MGRTFFFGFSGLIFVSLLIFQARWNISKVSWEKQSKFPEIVCPKFDFLASQRGQICCNAHLVSETIFSSEVYKFWVLKKMLHFLHKLVGMNPNITHMFRWAWIFRKKREREKEKEKRPYFYESLNLVTWLANCSTAFI